MTTSPLLPTALECRDITVRFGDVVAVDGVTASFERGRIHALVGQNGAGKTTLARVIAGLIRPDGGEVVVQETVLPGGEVRAARQAGIEMVHQSFALPPSMTVAEALEYGSVEGGRVFTRRALAKRWQAHLDDLGIAVSARARLSTLPIESLQAVEIARALAGRASVLILDEPTAVLPPESVDQLFDRVRSLRDRGVTVIMVLHKAREVLAVSDTVTVLRRGQLVLAGEPTANLTPERFAEAVIGEPLTTADGGAALGLQGDESTAPVDHAPEGRVIAHLKGLTSTGNPGLRGVDLDLRAGQIVGVAGVEGNGQVALAEVIAGLQPVTAGSLELAGEDATRWSARRRRGYGVRVIPFERNTEGLSATTPLWQNWAVPELQRGRLMSPRKLKAAAAAAFAEWDVRFGSVEQTAGELSGGNAQKVILSRELDADALVIVAAQPTRGLDLGATQFVWSALRRARDRGAAILLVSSDLDELEAISDRMIVLLGGELVLDTAPPYSTRKIGAAMTGATR